MIFLLIIKHYICDIELQPNWMATSKGLKKGYGTSLFLHCLVHGLGTWVVFWLLEAPYALIFALSDMGVHWCIDRGKSLVIRKIRAYSDKKPYHRLYVADQSLHFAYYCLVCLLMEYLWN